MSKKNKKQKAVNKQKNNNNKTFLQILIEWLTWQKAGVIIAGIGVFVSIIIFLLGRPKSPSEIETIKSDILKDIGIIENTFNPDDQTDSLIIEFEKHSLKSASFWKILNEDISFKSYSDKDISELIYVLDQFRAHLDQFETAYKEIFMDCRSIRLWESSKGINDANSVISINKLNLIKDYCDNKNEIIDGHLATCKDYLIKCQNTSQNNVQFYINKACEQLDMIADNPEIYKFDKLLFELIIQTNNLYLSKYR